MSVSLIIILITAAVSIPAFKNTALFYRYDFDPSRVKSNKEYIRFLSHAFLHADWLHLIINMLVLWMFGDLTQYYFEFYLGTKGVFYFILLYLGSILFAVLPSYKKHQDNPYYHSVGASGAVSAVVFSSVMFDPGNMLCLYGLPFLCFPGIVWAVVYLFYSYQKSKKADDRINHDAHFWGAVFGIVFTFLTIPESFPQFLNQISRLLPF